MEETFLSEPYDLNLSPFDDLVWNLIESTC
jgi:hypothetical protein